MSESTREVSQENVDNLLATIVVLQSKLKEARILLGESEWAGIEDESSCCWMCHSKFKWWKLSEFRGSFHTPDCRLDKFLKS